MPLTSRFSVLEVLVASTPILLTGAAVALAFRGGYWNIGAEGQLLVGAIMAAAVGQIAGLPQVVAVPLMILGGALGGALVGARSSVVARALRDRRSRDHAPPQPGRAAACQRAAPRPVARPGLGVPGIATDRRGGGVPPAARAIAAPSWVPRGPHGRHLGRVRGGADTGRTPAASRRPEPARRTVRRASMSVGRCS